MEGAEGEARAIGTDRRDWAIDPSAVPTRDHDRYGCDAKQAPKGVRALASADAGEKGIRSPGREQ